MAIKINKIIISIIISFAGLYSLYVSELLAHGDLFYDYDQKYNDPNDNPNEQIRLEMLRLERDLNTSYGFAEDTEKNIEKSAEAEASITLEIALLCGSARGVSHDKISICSLNFSKNKRQFTFPKSGKILSVVLEGSGRGRMIADYTYYDGNIYIYNNSQNQAYNRHDCQWDLGGKSVRLDLKPNWWTVNRYWQAHGAKTYTANYSIGSAHFSQTGREASNTRKANNCIFNEAGLDISRKYRHWQHVKTVRAYSSPHRKGDIVREMNLDISFNKGDELVFYFLDTDLTDGYRFRCASNESVAFTEVKWPRARSNDFLITSIRSEAEKPLAKGNCGDDGKATVSVKYDN